MINELNNDAFTEFLFNGFKSIKAINCNSEWLLNYLHFLEWDLQVESYFQPDMHLESEYAQTQIKVKIDMWVNLQNGDTYLIHFKKKGVKRSPIDHENIQSDCEKFCKKSHMHFQIIDQNIPEIEPRRSNINLLWSYARQNINLGHLLLIKRFFTDEPLPNIGKMKQLLTEYFYDPNLVYTFLFHHIINAETTRFPLSDKTPLINDNILDISIQHVKY